MKDQLELWMNQMKSRWQSPRQSASGYSWLPFPLLLIVIFLIGIGMYWSDEPGAFDIVAITAEKAPETRAKITTGSYTTSSLIEAVETMLNKRGGYLSNDIMPPSLWLDNIPNWEFGVLVQVRDLARSMRNDFSRSQSQSSEDVDLIVAEPQFNFDSKSWIFPATYYQN